MKEISMKITTSNDVLIDQTSTIGRLENERLAATIRIDNDAMEITRLTQLQYRQAPCHKFCEATAFNIETRALKAERDAAVAELSKVTDELFALSQDDGKIERALDRANEEIARFKSQEPVAWYEYNADLDAWFISYGYNPRAKTRPLVFGDVLGAPPVKAGWVMVPKEPS
jgi:hypothetical protein